MVIPTSKASPEIPPTMAVFAHIFSSEHLHKQTHDYAHRFRYSASTTVRSGDFIQLHATAVTASVTTCDRFRSEYSAAMTMALPLVLLVVLSGVVFGCQVRTCILNV